MQVTVCGAEIEDTKSEKLLGLNNQLSWKEYLYGETWRPEDNARGLIPQLSQRVGILSKIVKTMQPHRFSLFCNELFYSKLLYCLQVFGHVWNIPKHDDLNRRYSAFTKENNHKMQVILKTSGDLSVQQLTAFSSLLTAQKSIYYQEPVYLAEHFKFNQVQNPSSGNTIVPANYKLSVSRGGFFFRTTALFNNLPPNLRRPTEPLAFKREIKP